MNILGKLVRLRAVEEGDIPQLHQWANDPEIWYMLGGWHFPYSMESQKKWFLSLDADQHNLRLAMETLDGKKLIGTGSLTDIIWKDGRAEAGMMLGEKETMGKGYGTDALLALVRYAFEELRLARVNGSIIAYNEASLPIGEKFGFKDEGRRRNWFYRKGRHWDLVETGITRDDYFAAMARIKYWE